MVADICWTSWIFADRCLLQLAGKIGHPSYYHHPEMLSIDGRVRSRNYSKRLKIRDLGLTVVFFQRSILWTKSLCTDINAMHGPFLQISPKSANFSMVQCSRCRQNGLVQGGSEFFGKNFVWQTQRKRNVEAILNLTGPTTTIVCQGFQMFILGLALSLLFLANKNGLAAVFLSQKLTPNPAELTQTQDEQRTLDESPIFGVDSQQRCLVCYVQFWIWVQ